MRSDAYDMIIKPFLSSYVMSRDRSSRRRRRLIRGTAGALSIHPSIDRSIEDRENKNEAKETTRWRKRSRTTGKTVRVSD
jgi:hypothetical protein